MEPPALKEELKSVTTIPGALSVMTHGLLMMQMWHVGSLDSVALVSFRGNSYSVDVKVKWASRLAILPYRCHYLDWE